LAGFQEMLQPGSVFLRQVKKLDAISELRMVGYDQRFSWQSLIFDPENEIQLGSRWQGEAHLNVASKKTEIGSFGAAGNRCALWFEFNGNRNLGAGISSSLLLGCFVRLLGHGFVSFPNQTPLNAMVPLLDRKEKADLQLTQTLVLIVFALHFGLLSD
jgi:hypothetical protein